MSEKGTLENRPHRANLVLAGDKGKENRGELSRKERMIVLTRNWGDWGVDIMAGHRHGINTGSQLTLPAS